MRSKVTKKHLGFAVGENELVDQVVHAIKPREPRLYGPLGIRMGQAEYSLTWNRQMEEIARGVARRGGGCLRKNRTEDDHPENHKRQLIRDKFKMVATA